MSVHNDAPTITAIVPTCRRPGILPRALASVARQSVPPLEIIVIDNDPDPANEAVALSFGAKYLREPRPGKAHAFNRGVAAASGAYVSLLDDDDEWLPEKVATETRVLVEHPTLDALGPGAVRAAPPAATTG